MKSSKLYFTLLVIGIAISFYLVWSPTYFLTGDGPCHLMNANTLLEYFSKENKTFFSEFYTLNSSLNANWFSHGLLMIFLKMISPEISEKIFVSIYILTFVIGFHQLIMKVNPEGKFLVLMIFCLVFNTTLVMGFYSFNMSISLIPWYIFIYIKLFENISFANLLFACILSFLLFWTHPIPYIFGFIGVSFIYLFYYFKEQNQKISFYIKRWGIFMLFNIPWLLISFIFNQSKNPSTFKLYFNKLFITEHLFRFTSFQCYTKQEDFLLIGIALSIILICIVIVIKDLINKEIVNLKYSFLLLFGGVMVIYIFFPDNYACQLLQLRLQIIAYLILIMFIASSKMKINTSKVISCIFFLGFLFLSFVRFPIIKAQSKSVAEIMECKNLIQAQSIVLPICFAANGLDKSNNFINSKIGSFIHATQYLGANIPLIFLDNYEANTTWFPLVFKPNLNPYKSSNNFLELNPPSFDINQYEVQSKKRVDYILLLYYNENFKEDAKVKRMMNEIESSYVKIFSSSQKNLSVYQNKISYSSSK